MSLWCVCVTESLLLPPLVLAVGVRGWWLVTGGRFYPHRLRWVVWDWCALLAITATSYYDSNSHSASNSTAMG